MGDNDGEMGDYLPMIDLGDGVDIQYLHIAYDHSCFTSQGYIFRL